MVGYGPINTKITITTSVLTAVFSDISRFPSVFLPLLRKSTFWDKGHRLLEAECPSCDPTKIKDDKNKIPSPGFAPVFVSGTLKKWGYGTPTSKRFRSR